MGQGIAGVEPPCICILGDVTRPTTLPPRAPRAPLAVAAVVLTLIPALAASGRAEDAKVPLSHDVYDSWRSIRGEKLSDDGAWLLYAEVPQDGDAELVVRSLTGEREHRAGLGWLTATSPFPRVEASFAPDGGHVVFLASPAKETVKKAKKDGDKGDKAPKKSLGILDLASGEIVTVERVKSFAVPEDAGHHVAYLMEKPLKEEDAGDEAAEKQEPEAEPEEPAEPQEPAAGEKKPAGEKEKKKKKEDKDFGTELRIRSLVDGAETSAESVMSTSFAPNGERLLYVVSSKEDPARDGVYSLAPAGGATHALRTGEGHYEHLTLDEEGTRFAFVTDTADYAADEPVFELYGGSIDADAAQLWVSHASTEGFPAGMAVSNKEGVSFSDDGAVVMFGIRARPEPKADDDDEDDAEDAGDEDDGEEADDEDEVSFDLWHWQDPYPQPQQLLVADEVRNETYESVWWIDAGRFVQLADEDLPDVRLSRDGHVAMGTTDRRWAARGSYEGFFDDVYVVDTHSGERTRVAERVSWSASLSPGGAYVAWFGGDGDWRGYDRNGGGGFAGGQDWFLYDVATGQTRNLTEGMDVPFERHDWDTPSLPAPYGAAGFTEDDGALLIYDRFDVWAIPTTGGEARRITDGVGGERRTAFRWVRLDPDQEGVPVDRPILLAGTDDETMATGFWVDRVEGAAPPVELMHVDANLGFRDLADDADTFLFTRQTFSEYPDLWVGALRLGDAAALAGVRKVTELGAQTEPYVWGRAELRDFRSADGVPLKGILIKPEDFDPSRKYPLMVYIYETLHQGLHGFRDPSPGTSINPSYYVSNGYVLWMPDIEYVTPGYPGKDALKSVLPGIDMLVREGWVNPDAIGIQGHSWGGYQIAYMVTQTDVFAAAEAGAPVSNMTSAYGGIRWGSGLVRQFQYERTQSRLGASLWEVPLRFIENSPLFWADAVDTPLLILHNDKDGAVPWYQGIELIMALRRLDKEAYMFNYNGEDHGLRQRKNQQDWTVRLAQFFDHHLKGAPAPEWMTEGIRGWEKGEVDR